MEDSKPPARTKGAIPKPEGGVDGDGGGRQQVMGSQTPAIPSSHGIQSQSTELPFLVTHYLHNFAATSNENGEGAKLTPEQAAQQERIRRAAAELASAFTELGAFGTAFRPSLSGDAIRNYGSGPNAKPATYADMNRKWGGLDQNHLEAVVTSATAASAAADRCATIVAPTNLLKEAGPLLHDQKRARKAADGRRAQNAIDVDGDNQGAATSNGGRHMRSLDDAETNDAIPSCLQRPVHLQIDENEQSRIANSTSLVKATTPTHLLEVRSKYKSLMVEVSGATRQMLDQREVVQTNEEKIRSLQLSLNKTAGHAKPMRANKQQQQTKVQKQQMQTRLPIGHQSSGLDLLAFAMNHNTSTMSQKAPASATSAATSATSRSLQPPKTKRITSAQASAQASASAPFMAASTTAPTDSIHQRVASQLRRQLDALQAEQEQEKKKLGMLESKLERLRKECTKFNSYYDHSVTTVPYSRQGNVMCSPVLQDLVHRQTGIDNSFLPQRARRKNRIGVRMQGLRKNFFQNRLSHALTTNVHLHFPVYCLRFDRSGRFFVTGADDFLVKVFHLGAGKSRRARKTPDGSIEKTSIYGANVRGAVLVCSLRGHAGVINDIDVSSDNCFLATASVDGDCRVWGLKDGCPIAILRGHTGGANMVSWSKLTPYRLITTSADGFARLWDVREATLKRYGSTVGRRPEYNLALLKPKKKASSKNDGADGGNVNLNPNQSSPPSGAEVTTNAAAPSGGNSSNTNTSSGATLMAANPSQAAAPVAAPIQIQGGVATVQNVGPPMLPLPPSLPLLPHAAGTTAAAAAAMPLVLPPLPPLNPLSPLNPLQPSGPTQPMHRNAVPPLPAAAAAVPPPNPPLPRAAGNNNANRRNNNVQIGQFVANDNIDEGVLIAVKYPHDAGTDDPQHLQQQQQRRNVGTRSSRKRVSVICVTRHPLGGYFVTGSDDGVCRVWKDCDDEAVALIDQKLDRTSQSAYGALGGLNGSRKPRSTSSGVDVKPILKLVGHTSAVTDLVYSHVGDRILSASQKDGVVRIWFLDQKLKASARSKAASHSYSDSANVSHIVINLTNPEFGQEERRSSNRRRRNANAKRGPSVSNTVSCDVAVWSRDDSKIFTSQCILAKQSDTEVRPGSQYIFLWESRTGHCLLGIANAHQMQCPVIMPHPFNDSIVCTAGADGWLKAWDCESGRCLFSHANKLEPSNSAVPVRNDAKTQTKLCGFLDGSFSPDGTYLVLTDDKGRVCIFDSMVHKLSTQDRSMPYWIQQQYFANDYYDLRYDTNGYCIERGSERPPHLAPRAVRVNHTGAPMSTEITETFQSLTGPVPVDVEESRRIRCAIRANRLARNSIPPQAVHDSSMKIRRAIREFDPNSTILVNGFDGRSMYLQKQPQSSQQATPPIAVPFQLPFGTQQHSEEQQRQLSSNYRWRDYEDILREQNNDDDANETDDEEFDPTATRRASVSQQQGSDESDDELIHDATVVEDMYIEGMSVGGSLTEEGGPQQPRQQRAAARQRARRDDLTRNGEGRVLGSARSRPRPRPQPRSRTSPRPRSRTPQRPGSARSTRSSSNSPSNLRQRSRRRRQRRRFDDDDDNDHDDNGSEIDSESEVAPLLQYLSTNNTPSGPYLRDYEQAGHFWRMPKGLSESTHMDRKWLMRLESDTSYTGHKTYCPQAGDTVVYIPRAHQQVLKEFPGMAIPWQTWPTGTDWPVVRCVIRAIRYRFPPEDYIRHRRALCTSIVAILILEVTGIPDVSAERAYPWQAASFIPVQTRYLFEVSKFENKYSEFIVPYCLYSSRIAALEAAIQNRNGNHQGLTVKVFYGESDEEDAEMAQYESYVQVIHNSDETNSTHLSMSGFESIHIRDGTGFDEHISPWEIDVEGATIARPSLTNDEKKLAIDSLVNAMDYSGSVRQYFAHPLNLDQYPDYMEMVEVPMNLLKINARVQQGFYSSKLSAIADVQLVRDNCIKFNGIAHTLSQDMIEVYRTFVSLMLLSEDESSNLLTEEGYDTLLRQQSMIDVHSLMPPPRQDAGAGTGAAAGRTRRTRSSQSQRPGQRHQHQPGRVLPQRQGRQPGSQQQRQQLQRPDQAVAAAQRGRRARTRRSAIDPGDERQDTLALIPQRRDGTRSAAARRGRQPVSYVEAEDDMDVEVEVEVDNEHGSQPDSHLAYNTTARSRRERMNRRNAARTTTDDDTTPISGGAIPPIPPRTRRSVPAVASMPTRLANEDDDDDDDDDDDSHVGASIPSMREWGNGDIAGMSRNTRGRAHPQRSTRRQAAQYKADSDYDEPKQEWEETQKNDGHSDVDEEGKEEDDDSDASEHMDDDSDDGGGKIAARPRRNSNGNGSSNGISKNNKRARARAPTTGARKRPARGTTNMNSNIISEGPNTHGISGETSQNESASHNMRSTRRSLRRGSAAIAANGTDGSNDQRNEDDDHRQRNSTGSDDGPNPQGAIGHTPGRQTRRAQRARLSPSAPQQMELSAANHGEDTSALDEADHRRHSARIGSRARRPMYADEDSYVDEDMLDNDEEEDSVDHHAAPQHAKYDHGDDSDIESDGDGDEDDEVEEENDGDEDDEVEEENDGDEDDEVEEEDDGDEDEGEDSTPTHSTRSGMRRRRGAVSATAPPHPAKRRRAGSGPATPDLAPWPDIEDDKLVDVCEHIMKRICALDRSDTFSAPVVETYPALATTYYKVIRDPMDFRTIREDRMDHYESIQELQQDLILVFSNCCKFNNGPATDIYEHAIKLWSEINHIFQVTCNKFRIRLPEGWDAS